jgi:hypothetical protein
VKVGPGGSSGEAGCCCGASATGAQRVVAAMAAGGQGRRGPAPWRLPVALQSTAWRAVVCLTCVARWQLLVAVGSRHSVERETSFTDRWAWRAWRAVNGDPTLSRGDFDTAGVVSAGGPLCRRASRAQQADQGLTKDDGHRLKASMLRPPYHTLPLLIPARRTRLLSLPAATTLGSPFATNSTHIAQFAAAKGCAGARRRYTNGQRAAELAVTHGQQSGRAHTPWNTSMSIALAALERW